MTKRFPFNLSEELSGRIVGLSNDSSFRLLVLLLAAVIRLKYVYGGTSKVQIAAHSDDANGAGNGSFVIDVRAYADIKQLVIGIARQLHADEMVDIRRLIVKSLWEEDQPGDHGDKDEIEVCLQTEEGGVIFENSQSISLSFYRKEQVLTGSAVYPAQNYKEEYIRLLCERWKFICNAFLDTSIGLQLLDPIGEYEYNLLRKFSGKQVVRDLHRSIPHYLRKISDSDPDRIAVVYNDEHLTYRKIDEKVSQLARLLAGNGCTTGCLVGIWLDRSPEMMIAILAVWNVGAIYIPLDKKDPVERNAYIVKDAFIQVLITDSSQLADEEVCQKVLAFPEKVICLDRVADKESRGRELNAYRLLHSLGSGTCRFPPANYLFQCGGIGMSGGKIMADALQINALMGQWEIRRIGIVTRNALYGAIGLLAAARSNKPYLKMAAGEEAIRTFISEEQIDLIISESCYADQVDMLGRESDQLTGYILLDEYDGSNDRKQAQVKELWDVVSNQERLEINDYGWNNSYNGEKFPPAEMLEYIGNFKTKLKPFLNDRCNVLEVGCGHGLVFFEIANQVRRYTATDLTGVILERNKERAGNAGLRNIDFYPLGAYDIDKIQDRKFDLIICSSVVHYFPNTLYLRDVIQKMIALIEKTGIIYLDDVIDLCKKEELTNSVKAYKELNPGAKSKTNWDTDLLVDPAFFYELKESIPEIVEIELSGKLGKIENELTKFRYDVIIKVEKQPAYLPTARVGTGRVNRRLTRKDWAGVALPEKENVDLPNIFEPGSLIDATDIKEVSVDRAIADTFDPGAIAYVIYTSGSTGRPKGAMVQHGGMMNHIEAKIADIGLTSKDVLAQVASHTFDISIWQFFTSFIASGKTVIFDNDSIFDVSAFPGELCRHHITVAEVVPSYLDLLSEQTTPEVSCLNYLFVTGEEVRQELLERTVKRYPGAKIVNAYGPTEASDDITHYFIDPVNIPARIPVGRPLPNCAIAIAREDGRLAAIGEPGEIWVSGLCVGKGYLNEPERTHGSFVHHSFVREPVRRFYRTGDIGRWHHNGEIEFIERKDHQVKISGHRIELGEIESCLMSYPGIKRAVVIAKTEEAGKKYLCAFYESGEMIAEKELREHAGKKLPDYMIPGLFKRLNHIPLTPNGKIDRNALDRISLEDKYIRFLDRKELNALAAHAARRENKLRKISAPADETIAQMGAVTPERKDIDCLRTEETFISLFKQQVKARPDHIAVSLQNDQLSYAELDRRSESVACELIKEGVLPGMIVAVCLHRTIESVISLLGVIRAGGTYLFLDPSYPPERLSYMLQDTKAGFVLIAGDTEEKIIGYPSLSVRCINIGRITAPEAGLADRLPLLTADSIAYIMYTSGSTGSPNGVIIEHGNLASFLLSWSSHHRFTPTDKLLLISSLSFDVSIGDIGSALICGSEIIVGTGEDLLSMADLHAVIGKKAVTVVDSVPALIMKYGEYVHTNRLRVEGLRLAIVGGDIFKAAEYRRLRKWMGPDILIVNGYGPTEATIYASFYTAREEEESSISSLPIGYPCLNAAFYVLDGENRFLQTGQTGELAIGGSSVARGYLNRVEATHEKFIRVRFSDESEERVYRTGDRGVQKENGCMDFLGRNDHQVKIDGYRVELLEIESIFMRKRGIDQAVVVPIQKDGSKIILVAYLRSKERIVAEEIREHLSWSLPAHMIPSVLVQLDEIPLTANQKINRLLLQSIEPEVLIAEQYEASRDVVDEHLREMWASILRIDKAKIGIGADFFELGATSLEAILLASKIKQLLNVNVPVNAIFERPILRDIADRIKERIDPGDMSQEYIILQRSPVRGKNIFIFPPMVAYGFVYMNIKSFFPDHSLYAFNFIEEDSRIELYLNAIREIQPTAPYVLLGYSAPGELMAQIASGLESSGAMVKLVFLDCARTSLFDHYFQDKHERDLSTAVSQLREQLKKLNYSLNGERVFEKVKKYFKFTNTPVELPSLKADICLLAASGRDQNIAGLAKEIREKQGGVEQSTDELIAYLNWETATTGRYVVMEGSGVHEEMLQGEHLQKNAGLIRHQLDSWLKETT